MAGFEVIMYGRFWVIPEVVAVVAVIYCVAPRRTLGSATPSDQSTFSDLEHQWMNAVKRQDIAALERILAPEFTLTVAIEGLPLESTGRADYLAACKGYYVIHEFTFNEIAVRRYGEVAVVISRYRQKATLGGTEDRSAEYFLTDTWVRHNGVWKVVARYSSRPEKA
jgi:ketosteroid isomerase-like protein